MDNGLYPYEKNGDKVYNSIEPNDIPDGRVIVPFTTDIGLRLKFVAGFLGAQQRTLENSNELVISPIIGWSIIDDKGDDKDDNKTNKIKMMIKTIIKLITKKINCFDASL